MPDHKRSYHRERGEPYLIELRQGFLSAYSDALQDINRALAIELQRAGSILPRPLQPPSAIQKSDTDQPDPDSHHIGYYRHNPANGEMEFIESHGAAHAEAEGGEEKLPSMLETAFEAEEPEAETPKKKRSKKAAATSDKKGQWYRDDAGHLRFGTEKMGRFDTPLNDDEAAQLTTHIEHLIGRMPGDRLNDLADFMGMPVGVLETMRECANGAAAAGVALDEHFINTHIAAQFDPNTEKYFSAQDPDAFEGTLTEQQATKEAQGLYGNMIQAYAEAAKSNEWQKRGQAILEQQKTEDLRASERYHSQDEILKGEFSNITSGDIQASAIKAIGALHDLGIFTFPQTLSDAKKYTNDDDQAYDSLGNVLTDTDRYNTYLKYLDDMSPEQQVHMLALGIANRFITQRDQDDDSFDEQAFRDSEAPAVDALRIYLENSDKTFTDQEWTQVADRVLDLGKHIGNYIDDYNHHRGGDAFKLLFHGDTSFEKLITDPGEVGSISARMEDRRQRVERARAAQKDYDHPTADIVLKGARAKMKAKGNPNWEKADLLKHQRAAVAWMTTIKRGVLAAAAGLGKTPMIIATSAELMKAGKIKRCCLTLPANLVAQWPNEVRTFHPGATVQMISSDFSMDERLRKLRAINSGELKADYVIMSAGTANLTDESRQKLKAAVAEYKQITGKNKLTSSEAQQLLHDKNILKDDPLVQEIKKLDGMMIYDEAHSGGQGLKSPDNLHHHIAKEVLEGREYAFGATATPITQGAEDLFHLMNLFNAGSAGESLAKFQHTMVKFEPHINPDTGEENEIPVELDRQALKKAKNDISPYVFFQSKGAKVVTDEMQKAGMKLSNLRSTAHALTLDGQAKELYNTCGDKGFDDAHIPLGGRPEGYKTDHEIYDQIVKKTGSTERAESVMKMRRFIRQQKCAISPKLIDKDYTGPQPKIDWATDIVTRHFNDPDTALKNKEGVPIGHKPVAIFSSFLDSLELQKQDLIAKKMPEHLIGVITGDVSPKERAIMQEAFNKGQIKVLLIGIQAGGAGLNLQEASNRMIFLDKPWTPAEAEQCVGRLLRTGNPSDTVDVHHAKIAGSTDDKKYNAIKNRVKTIDALTFAELDDDYLADTIAGSINRLAGDFDEDATEWTQEQKESAMQAAGLKTGDVTPLKDLDVVRSKFDRQAFGENVKKNEWKAIGDQKIEERGIMNELNYKDKAITDRQYKERKEKIAQDAREWMGLVGAALDHPVARYAGENWHHQTEAENSIVGAGGTTADYPVNTRAMERSNVKNVPDSPAMPLAGVLKGIKLKSLKNPYSPQDARGALLEVLRRSGLSDISAVVNVVSDRLQKATGLSRQDTLGMAKGMVINVAFDLEKAGLVELSHE